VMEQFRDELSLQLPPGVELPDLPPTGSLDLSQVLDSEYFFA
jgi:DNA-directed RNA polymerase